MTLKDLAKELDKVKGADRDMPVLICGNLVDNSTQDFEIGFIDCSDALVMCVNRKAGKPNGNDEGFSIEERMAGREDKLHRRI